jgi:hypothetical protein
MCPDRCHYSCSVVSELHWASTLGADEQCGAEFAFYAVDLVDQCGLADPKSVSSDGECGVACHGCESLQPLPSADSGQRGLDQFWGLCRCLLRGEAGGVAGPAPFAQGDRVRLGPAGHVRRTLPACLAMSGRARRLVTYWS